MAPISSTAVGVSPQTIDDPRLERFLATLKSLEQKYSEDLAVAACVPSLVTVLEPLQSWIFEEQIDLQEWIKPLNLIDATLSYFIREYPSLLLIAPVKRKARTATGADPEDGASLKAKSLADVAGVPESVVHDVCVIVRFLAGLLRNAANKSIFNSVEELVDLLAAADDEVASSALDALCNLATPPSLHKQQAPEVHQHSTALHNSKTSSHRRLIALARGWGSRGSGLGLYTCVTADDSEYGQGSLPAQAGELNFAFFPSAADGKEGQYDDSDLVTLHLSISEMSMDEMQVDSPVTTDESGLSEDNAEANKQKRRKLGSRRSKSAAFRTKSTAELFFLCLEKAGGRDKIPEDRLFPLLADIRLARSFHSNVERVVSIERRLKALIAILHSHPSQDIMSGYFQAQPELCVELIDLLRPTVSSASVSAVSTKPNQGAESSPLKQDAMAALAECGNVPYNIRLLAVEALTALVARRDGAGGALTGVARHSSVLNELGVGKGQYLGLLPTLIRYSLASLASFLSMDEKIGALPPVSDHEDDNDALAIDVGISFVEATMRPPLPRYAQLERALEFVDAVLTLTSSVVSAPSGTSALTDCGLIPALLTTVAVDSRSCPEGVLPGASSFSEDQVLRIKSLLRFIAAQAVQILEGAIVTHNNALSAFHDLQGVEVLTTRLSKEIAGVQIKRKPLDASEPSGEMDRDDGPTAGVGKSSLSVEDAEMEDVDASEDHQGLRSSQRVLLFSIVTCLTVVFHQESTSSSVTAPSGAAQLRKPELTVALVEIMDNVQSYGGHLASLIATLLSDVMNSDPHVVRHVHESGLASSFIKMLLGEKSKSGDGQDVYIPILPPVPELIMAVPNVISALALTEDGAAAVRKANPFPSLLRLFYHPNYAMPKSRCLLNELTAIVGTGLDEVMRHVQSLRPLVITAIADALNEVANRGEDLSRREEDSADYNARGESPPSDLENERSCLMQYALNFGQLLEQVLHNEDHCEPFVDAGGLDSLLRLFPCLMPSGSQFLYHVSSLSCPAVSTLSHSTTEESLSLAFKCIAIRYDSLKMIKKMMNVVRKHFQATLESQAAVKSLFPSSIDTSKIEEHDPYGILAGVPKNPLHEIDSDFVERGKVLSRYLRQVATLQWLTNLLAVVIKSACQRSQEAGSGWSRTEREWKKELSSHSFEDLLHRLSQFHQSAIFEVCRARTEEGFETREQSRLERPRDSTSSVRYRLRIVCQEGAVVRDGIEIDSCASVGSMEMGEIVEAFDRCVNSSGVLRYRTRRGWVSEQTRGHGREPIAEVIAFWRSACTDSDDFVRQLKSSKARVESHVPDLCSVGASVVARLQTSYSELFSALSRVVVHGVRALPVRTVSFQDGTIGSHLATTMRFLSLNIREGFNKNEIARMVLHSGEPLRNCMINEAGAAMYLGCMLSHLHACLFDEKRERRMLNLPLLVMLVESKPGAKTSPSSPPPSEITFFDATGFVFEQGLKDFSLRAGVPAEEASPDEATKPHQRVNRSVAASLPPSITLFRRLMSGPLISSSPVASVLSRMKRADLATLFGEPSSPQTSEADSNDAFFQPESFARVLHCAISDTMLKAWMDPRIVHVPPYIVHPIATLVGEILVCLEEGSKKRTSQPSASRSVRPEGNVWDPFARTERAQGGGGEAGGDSAEEEVFEPNEESVSRLVEMGFGRDHALDALESTQSNRVEVAMEYALSHPPPSPGTVERRRAEREERRQRIQRRRTTQEASGGVASEPATGTSIEGSPGTHSNADSPDAGQDAAAESNPEESSASARNGNPASDTDAMDTEVPASAVSETSPGNTDASSGNEYVEKAKLSLGRWIKEAPQVACDILAGYSSSRDDSEIADTSKEVAARRDDGKGDGDGEVEALTVVLCSFLLDLCQRYPAERNRVVSQVLSQLRAQLEEVDVDGAKRFAVIAGKESSFAAFCHAAVLFTKALPETRSLVLKENLIRPVLSCIQTFTLPFSDRKSPAQASLDLDQTQNDLNWPMWLPPSLLLLDIMAQPVVAFSNESNAKKADENEDSDATELAQVRQEHKNESASLAALATRIFAEITAQNEKTSVVGNTETSESGQQTVKRGESSNEEGSGSSKQESKIVEESPFSTVPAYFPLLPSDVVESCASLCLSLLRRGCGEGQECTPPPPGVVHATLLLLMRILRTPKMSSHCLRMGAAEVILSLPRECRFTGNSGLVTLIFRHLLEDEATLQAAMEHEIRSTITKLHRKQKKPPENDKICVSRRAFFQAVTPLLCRDPASFLTALVLSVNFGTSKSQDSDDLKVYLLSQAERARNSIALSRICRTSSGFASPGKALAHRKVTNSPRQKRGVGTTQKHKPSPRVSHAKRSTQQKRQRKDRSEEPGQGKYSSVHGSPSSYVTSLLVSNIMASVPRDGPDPVAVPIDDSYKDDSFLWTANLLEVLADLVLAVPACAVAVHKYRLHRNKDRARSQSSSSMNHALSGAPNPPKTFVSFLLHCLLPQDRWSIRKDQQIWERRKDDDGEESEALKKKKKDAYRRTKVAQTSARLIVALVARPGEGRRRVIADLVFALSGGRLGHSAASTSILPAQTTQPGDGELHALLAWGDLCIGLAAPRSNGINLDGLAFLSLEVVKIMLEYGMAHALLIAIQRVHLNHPMAVSVCSSLLLPFEILTRGNVSDAAKTAVETEEANQSSKAAAASTKASKNSEPKDASMPSQQDDAMAEGFVQNHGIDEGFVGHGGQDVQAMQDVDMLMEAEEEDATHEEEEEEEEAVAEMEDDVDDSDDESSSSSESSESSEMGMMDVISDQSGEEEEDGSILEEDETDSDEIEDGGDMEYQDELVVEDQVYDDTEEAGIAEQADSGLDEGWTRIESNGFGGVLLGGRRNGISVAGGALTSRARGFIDAAEAMIGTLLRSGEISGDALAEIQGSLGIRIVANGRSLGDLGNAGDPVPNRGGDIGLAERERRGEIVGTLPHIHQRSPPDGGYSALGGGGRWNEISSMEYVYGGPSVSAGSRNYDLFSPVPSQPEADHPNVSPVDGQLFPGGPASAAHPRTQHSLHPLLCGVDLPPVNSLVSDLLPHGVRATRRGQMTTRRPGDWTNTSFSTGGYLVSTSNGNIIRANRPHSGAPIPMMTSDRGVVGPVGWSDDGLPFDVTVEEFSAAFDRALGESVPASRNVSIAASGGDADHSDSHAASDTNRSENVEAPAVDSAVVTAGDSGPGDLTERNEADDLPGAASQEPVGQLDSSGEPNLGGNTNDSDGVASSLAAGLVLSPRSDTSSHSDRMSTANGGGDQGGGEPSPLDTEMTEASPEREVNLPPDASDGFSRTANADPALDDSSRRVEEDRNTAAIDSNAHGVREDDVAASSQGDDVATSMEVNSNQPNGNGLTCPPGMDLEVFNCLPLEMQQEVVEQNRVAIDVAAQLDPGSSLDPEALAALPEDMRREVIEQEQQERRLREQPPADPSNAQDMDNASFVASLSPELREEILLTADESLLNSLPPNIIAEAQILRERASAQHRRLYEDAVAGSGNREGGNVGSGQRGENAELTAQASTARDASEPAASSSRKKPRSGKLRVECERLDVVYLPPSAPQRLTAPVAKTDVMALVRLMYLLSPVRPSRLLQKVIQNLSLNRRLRGVLTSTFVRLLHDDERGARATLETLEKDYASEDCWRKRVDDEFSGSFKEFPPSFLIGAAPEVLDTEGLNPNITLVKRRQASNTAASYAASLPPSARGSRDDQYLPPVVATRMVDMLLHLCKNSPRFCHDILVSDIVDSGMTGSDGPTCFDSLLDLLEKPRYVKSSANLEQLLALLESAVSPLSHISRHGDEEQELSARDVEAAAAAGKEWVDVPRLIVSQGRLQLLCSILRMESCRDTAFTKVNTIARRLCRIEANRGYVLAELASVAHALGDDATRDMKALKIRMTEAAALHREQLAKNVSEEASEGSHKDAITSGGASSSVTLSTSTSELKLLRVLQTLQGLCGDSPDDHGGKKSENSLLVTEELVHLLRAMNLDSLWDELTACLKVVQVLEGVTSLEDEDKKSDDGNEDDVSDENKTSGKKLQNSVAGLLTRFLPSIEAFFVANASATREAQDKSSSNEGTPGGDHSQDRHSRNDVSQGGESPARGTAAKEDAGLDNLVGGRRLVEFVATNKVLLNALVRNNPPLLDKGLRSLIQIPRCRAFLDFDVKRPWFKTQVRRLRQHASRRHGSLRLHIRRKHVFEDAYHQLRLRNADEMRGRLHITFRNEEGVDAGGLSRDFFGILAKEIFNPNYALFTSTEDGCTFQPNPNSSINPDHLSYFRFVGRIVGKAVSDGFLLDAHFTRSLYKHMLGIKPTHHDMEAIDPDYYKNLKAILEYELKDLGLELTFSIDDHSFGRSEIIDLIPNGRSIPVTEENKEEYVSLVCLHRMSTSISSQIKSYLDGFYELVSPDLISIFNPRELELLISGLPNIDIDDLKRNTDYVGWKATDKEIEWFWKILSTQSRSQKAAFLQFVTGCSKVPLGGFSQLQGMRGIQKFSIHKVGGANGALMSAHTCFNSLDLPVYKSEDEMREKFLLAINEGTGAFMIA